MLNYFNINFEKSQVISGKNLEKIVILQFYYISLNTCQNKFSNEKSFIFTQTCLKTALNALECYKNR